MVYLLLLMLGLIVLVQSYLLFSLTRSQRDLQVQLARLLRNRQQASTSRRKKPIERGRIR
ncbi:hypothetical protein I588_00077 [Enterococcus pallens ATCC BAA-351]|uniref:Uncharacterized protein n=1 Tax=Enterococcus pallens ATCC BAA-351 TaxID=1158607 RepID=R2SMV0_9ENTE|nr:hypothetical protein UAU_01946 [Enterococcus pallens ATCC BAA-351]EOU24090.1 hypothetical protein I588_00077 [Enterococcus pallens ATCC BAA-351]